MRALWGRRYLGKWHLGAQGTPAAAYHLAHERSGVALPRGTHGFDCEEQWGLNDRFLPSPERWLRQWNASARAVVNCQRGFFDAFAARLTRAHWEVEWDAQPFRISAVPPRTIGKMIHQLVTANFFHFTLGQRDRPPLRRRLGTRVR